MKKEMVGIYHGCYQRKRQVILNRLDFSVCEGEVLGVVSLNNDELDALCNVLTGNCSLSQGTFSYRGKKIVLNGYSEAMSVGIYGIHRQSAIIAGEDVASNVYVIPAGGRKRFHMRRENQELLAAPLIPYPTALVHRQRAYTIVREFFDHWKIDIDVKKRAEDLSRAQQLWVEVARAVLGGARLIVMNRIGNYCQMEPGFLQDMLRRLKELRITVVFADNQLNPLMEVSDRILVLKKGMNEGVFERGELTRDQLAFLLADRSVAEKYVRQSRMREKNLFTLVFPGRGECSLIQKLELHAGEIVGIADMTERAAEDFQRFLSGKYRESDGKLWLDGQKVTLRSIKDSMRKGICLIDGRLPHFGLIPNENLAVNLNYQRLNRFYPFSKAGARTLLRVAFEEQAERIGCFREDYSKYPEQLTAIQQLQLYLVRARQLKAKVLVMISPSIHLDFVSRQQMCALIDQCAEEGMAILLFSINTSVISDLCDRLILIQGSDLRWLNKPKNIPLI
ncbi:hypothetical protein [Hominifimenecus sp. rT4P-3]|uniref:hypothetical protein n=1 Tax=Hominifimenecus sp. rT4P-3 TaxID=3242979 RepID=UPI003DA42BF5